MRRVKLAIDGCGVLTTSTILHHLMEQDFCDLAEVVSVCDIVPERAKETASQFGISHWSDSLESMLESTDAEAVLVIVPHSIHAEHARKIVSTGRHVYVQKPMARTLAEGQLLVDEARLHGAKIVAAPGQCLWPMYERIREVIQSGAIGKPYWAMPPMMGWGGTEVYFKNNPSWFFSDEAGPLRDHGGYGFQSLVSLFGSVKRIGTMAGIGTPTRKWRDTEFAVTTSDNTVSMLDFGEACFGLLPECWCETAPSMRLFRILGLEGSIETDPETFNGLNLLPIGATICPNKGEPFRIEVPLESVPSTLGRHPHLGNTHVYGDILHLVDCIRENADPIASGERALHFVDAIECAFESTSSGQIVPLRTP